MRVSAVAECFIGPCPCACAYDLLGSHVADQIDVVIQVTHKVLADVLCGAARVADELALGHLVLHVWAAQVDGEQDERVAQHVHGICNTRFTLLKK